MPNNPTTEATWTPRPATKAEIKDMIRLLDGDGTRARYIAPCREDAEVLALCECYGFGAVMDSAARQWFKRDPNGSFVVGPCAAIARSAWEGAINDA